MEFSKWKEYAVYFICIMGVILALPNIMPKHIVDNLPFSLKKMSLGLDLRGGAHMSLDVDIKSALKDQMNMMVDCVRHELRKENIKYKDLPKEIAVDVFSFEFDLIEDAKISRASHVLKNLDESFSFENKGLHCKMTMKKHAISQKEKDIVDRSIEVVRRRVDDTGTKEINVQREGENRILLQIPGIEDPSEVKKILGKTAKMVFRIVDDTIKPDTEENSDFEWLENKEGGKLAVKKQILVSGETLMDSRVDKGEYNQIQVGFKFNALGSKKFGEATRENIGKRLAIVLDNVVISAPVIQDAILGGSGVINSERFSVSEAKDLALLLRAGALPAPLTIVEEKMIGPDLGQDSIRSGVIATIISILIVVGFMFMWYSSFGWIANFALIMNVVILIGVLSLLQATLTLPGIAGIALTIGTAVDVNILINERIKEELRKGRKMLRAIEEGYALAMSSIIDTNLNTILGMACLYYFGTGAIRGFAITTALGTVISFFTATTLTRFIVSKLIKARIKLNIKL